LTNTPSGGDVGLTLDFDEDGYLEGIAYEGAVGTTDEECLLTANYVGGLLYGLHHSDVIKGLDACVALMKGMERDNYDACTAAAPRVMVEPRSKRVAAAAKNGKG
jgi:hypothetical protein